MSLQDFWQSVTKSREVAHFTRLETRLRALFTPGDWAIASVFLTIFVVGAVMALAALSLGATVEVPLKGGTHVEGVVGSVRFINPLLAVSDTDQDLTALVFAGLMRETPNGLLALSLADKYDVSADGKTYTFHIAPKAEFQDGTPVTADDVVFTVHLAQNPDAKSPRRAAWEGVEVKKIDDRTVSFTLGAAYAPFLANTTLGILPAHRFTKVTPEALAFSDLNIHAIGAGPYKIDKVVTTSSNVPSEVRLSAFTHARTVPYITHFIVRLYADQDALQSAFTAHGVDAMYGAATDGAGAAHDAVYARIFAVFLNQNQNPLFADPAVRHALDTALNKQDLIRAVLGGYGTPLSGPLSTLAAPATSGDTIAEARATLVKDGWTLATSTSGQSVFVKKTKKETTRLAFTLTTANAPELKNAAEWIANAWRDVGVDVTTTFYDQTDLASEIIRPRTYDALLFGEVTGREPDLYAFWHSSQRKDPGLNIALYTSSVVDKLLEKARAESDIEKRNQDTEDAAHLISTDEGAIFLYAPRFTYVTERSLQGVKLTDIASPADRFDGVTDWYLATEHVWPFFAR